MEASIHLITLSNVELWVQAYGRSGDHILLGAEIGLLVDENRQFASFRIAYNTGLDSEFGKTILNIRCNDFELFRCISDPQLGTILVIDEINIGYFNNLFYVDLCPIIPLDLDQIDLEDVIDSHLVCSCKSIEWNLEDLS